MNWRRQYSVSITRLDDVILNQAVNGDNQADLNHPRLGVDGSGYCTSRGLLSFITIVGIINYQPPVFLTITELLEYFATGE